MNKKIIIIASVVIIALVGILIYRSQNKKPVYEVVEASQGEIDQIVSATGTVISAKEIDLQFENAGKIIKIEAEVGNKVTAGQVLARLDVAELNAQLKSAQAALEVAEAQLAQTLAGNRPEDVKIYETALINAETDLKNKEQALIDDQQDVENEINKAYENVLNVLNDSYNKAADAVYKQIDDLFINDNTNPELTFKTSNTQMKNNAEAQRSLVTNEMGNFRNETVALILSDHNSLDGALNNAERHLTAIRDLLDILMSALNDATSLTSTTLSTDKTNITTARTNINTAITNVISQEQEIATTKISNQVKINDAQASADSARAALKTAQDQLALKKAEPLKADVDLAKARVKQAQADVLQIQEKINKTVLKAPIDGFITLINKEEGEMAQTNAPIISIIAVDRFQIETNISETDIAKINLDDEVEMTLDALGPNEKLFGRIIKINPAETVVSGVIYYKVTSMFNAGDERIKPGMTANLDIKTDKRENVVSLPYYAINETNGHKYVKMLLDNGDTIDCDVKIGLEGEVNVEIIEGLKAGEKVVVFSEQK